MFYVLKVKVTDNDTKTPGGRGTQPRRCASHHRLPPKLGDRSPQTKRRKRARVKCFPNAEADRQCVSPTKVTPTVYADTGDQEDCAKRIFKDQKAGDITTASESAVPAHA